MPLRSKLDRAVESLGFKGALVNGYTSAGTLEAGLYYDDPRYDPLWERFCSLDAPIYLHPRNPLPDQRRIYAGREQLLGPTAANLPECSGDAVRPPPPARGRRC